MWHKPISLQDEVHTNILHPMKQYLSSLEMCTTLEVIGSTINIVDMYLRKIKLKLMICAMIISSYEDAALRTKWYDI